MGGLSYEYNTFDDFRSNFEIYGVVLGEKYVAQYNRNDYIASSEEEKRVLTIKDF